MILFLFICSHEQFIKHFKNIIHAYDTKQHIGIIIQIPIYNFKGLAWIHMILDIYQITPHETYNKTWIRNLINHYNHEYDQTQHEIHKINKLEVLKIVS